MGNPDHLRPGAIEVEDVFGRHIEEPEDEREDSADQGHHAESKNRTFHALNLSRSLPFP